MRVNNKVFLQRKNKIYVLNSEFKTKLQPHFVQSVSLTAGLLQNLAGLGYTLSQGLIDELKRLFPEITEKYCVTILNTCKELRGANVEYKPMYPNFPKQVAEFSDAELFLNAIVHYWSAGVLLPEYEKYEREPLLQKVNYQIIELGTIDEYDSIFANIMASKTSISETDKKDLMEYLEMLIKNNRLDLIPSEIPLKENIALIGEFIFRHCDNEKQAVIVLKKYFKTATDILRLLTAVSGGDVSLATNCKYVSLKRRERRVIIELLNSCGNIEEDMKRYHNHWIRVMEIIHPFEYAKYTETKAVIAFYKLANNHKIKTFSGKVQDAFNNKDWQLAVDLLKQRAGEFARNLDYLLRTVESKKDKNIIINSFKEIAIEVSTPVLLQVKEHFKVRNTNKSDIRVFFPKGNMAKQYCISNELPKIDEKYCQVIVAICENALVEHYKKLDFMGNVYLSEEFKNYIVPFSQRNASNAMKTVVRGSRIPFDNDNGVIRGFIHWTNTNDEDSSGWYGGSGRVDIDLSAVILNEDFEYMEHVSYTNLRSARYKAFHSGDIVNGGSVKDKGVAEFIDIDIDSIVKYGGRYVCFQVYNYTQQNFSTLPNALFGWMNREDCNSGEIFESSTVEQRIDLTQDANIEIPVVFDMVKREAIWMDMGLQYFPDFNRRFGGNNIESNISPVALTIKALIEMNKTNMYDLINLHIKARGIKVDNRDDADIIFDTDTTKPTEIMAVEPYDEEWSFPMLIEKDTPIVTPFDIDEIFTLI